ncbi:menaquinone-dependent protoporphyrinogen IX dehydrogenase [Shewanella avicenniae]|uniref:Protoporphyrinogen IX dehydrogenase [quinone] n=1 Tax=Shewanella avicenniae TaxID=2814294 RepID=A0ABX7QQF3_9GAMM|nr:menaquinone-dependent protoporphyrinogen IX dehydrogenase [Shewanella avicenniae]QSX33704.1 menaquinone-dependent protoporphyrinogen IX dehydrogenase [Shewanella avicenniae]
MANILLLYSTVDGQTRRICEAMLAPFAAHNAQLCSIEQASESQLLWADKILIGASIRYGKFRPNLFQFVNRYKALIDAKPNGFFCVNAVARKPNKNSPATNSYMHKFLRLSLWQPRLIGVFAGRIAYPQYGFWDRNIIRFIMWLTNGPTDVKQTYEFTDWECVRQFANEFLAK